MKRLIATASIALVAAGGLAACGDTPEDQALDAGESIGTSLGKLQQTSSAQDAKTQIDNIGVQLTDIKSELPAAYVQQLQDIVAQLQEDVSNAGGDPAKVRVAFADAATSIRSLQSTSNSVVNELRRGVSNGYDEQIYN